jgi:hypothetical protein
MAALDPRTVVAEQAGRRVLARLEQADAMTHSLGFFSHLIAKMAEAGENRSTAAQPRRAA